MNVLRIVSYIPYRTYARKVKNVGIEGKLQISKKSNLKCDIEEINEDDLDEFEAEYMNADKFYDIHNEEEKYSKERLKKQITAKKYFKKDKDPNFLTTFEKQEIRRLHTSNPEEWTIERLSESFPVLPETVKKILKANWSFTSPEQVLRYDSTVIENWKKFQAGKLSVDPILREHLQKFKARKILLPDRDFITKTLIPPKPKLPKPRSTFFTNIVQSYLDKNKENECNNAALQDGEKSIAQINISNISTGNNISTNALDNENSMKDKQMIVQNKDLLNKNISNKKLTLNEFTKRELPKLHEKRPEEGATLLHVYKQNLELENTVSNSEENNVQPKRTKTQSKEMTLNSLNERQSDTSQLVSVEEVDANLETYVKARVSKIPEHVTYPLPIKIPRNLRKKGKIYRICDCYYDDDGQFLYRTPGLRN